ncbi:ABC transporter substrate-binding protein [Pseudoroseomonas cervicalis]|uniref:ABC transporter, solute-binding protein n=1 Tax=Pseudoroseomonas cervicalis ATCC 49957 TaxID=525371 RepID=D5RTS4_9PROT|nr:ABC transporter substrate-binding protein [Pseudoroseomonas cervicalis]EFH09295.1 ABC transporter, solute-binding protein [Pseudoroseomonas cervicalis ATCC 49957]
MTRLPTTLPRRALLRGLPALSLTAALPPLAAPRLARAQGGVSGKLVLYTSQLEPDAARTVEVFRQRHPAVQVEWIRGGTNQILPRLRAELAAGAPRADVLLLADSLTFEGLKQEGLLRPSPEIDLAGTPAERHDPGRCYFGTKLLTTGIVMNNRAPFAPKSWADLLRPEARGLTAMPSPSVSGAAAIHVQAVAQAPSLGWGYWEKLAAAGLQPRGGNGAVMQAVAGGERGYGMIVDYMPIREAAKGAPVRFIVPEEGVSAITEPAAILKSSRNPEAAAAFIAFLLSREGQALAASQGFLPADPAVSPPAGFPDPKSLTLLPFDAARAAESAAADLARFNRIMGL